MSFATSEVPAEPSEGARRWRRRSKPEKPPRSMGQQIEWQVMVGAICLFAGGVVLTIAFLSWPDQGRIAAVGIGTFVAAGFVGAFAGFLFGLPRDAPMVTEDRSGLRFLVNSNLLKVSDFVTTIIVGLTLTQIGRVIPALDRYGDAIRKPLGGHDQSAAVGIALITIGFAGAAMLGYLWTTVRMRERLERAEMELRFVQRTGGAAHIAVDYVLEGERDIDAVQLSLAPLTQEQLREIQNRLQGLGDGDPGREGRMGEVRRAITERLKA
ncbi:MAG TPA: hypothetical protein VF228_17905 [Iamia sp.]